MESHSVPQQALASATAFIDSRPEFTAEVHAELIGSHHPRLRLVSIRHPDYVQEVAPEAWMDLGELPRTFILRMVLKPSTGRSKHD